VWVVLEPVRLVWDRLFADDNKKSNQRRTAKSNRRSFDSATLRMTLLGMGNCWGNYKIDNLR